MTVKELREVKAALKAEREAREKAEADYETVRDTLESMRHEHPRIEVRTEYVTITDESAESTGPKRQAKAVVLEGGH